MRRNASECGFWLIAAALLILLGAPALGETPEHHAMVRFWIETPADQEWMDSCDEKAKYTLLGWCSLLRASPGSVRALLRRICDGEPARYSTIGEVRLALQNLQTSCSCFCGATFSDKPAYDGHRGAKHRIDNPAKY